MSADRNDLIRRTFTAPPDTIYRAASKLGIASGPDSMPWLHRFTQILQVAERSDQLEALAELVEADRVA